MYYSIIGIVLLITGLTFGYVWPKKSWRWGLWISSPIIILIGLSVAFSGNVTAFLKHDLPVIFISLLAACSGSVIGAWFKKRRIQV
jgi:hypothetical protein